MSYIEEDLDWIYIRARSKDGRWDNLALSEINDDEFADWVGEFFGVELDRKFKWAAKLRVGFLNNMARIMGRDPVVMVKRDKRGELGGLKNGKGQ